MGELCSQLCKESWRWLQPTNQSIIIGLVDKENDIWKDDYSLNIEKTNQTIIIGLNNKTLEEDYYSLTQEPIKQQRMTLHQPNNHYWFGQQDTWMQEFQIKKVHFIHPMELKEEEEIQ